MKYEVFVMAKPANGSQYGIISATNILASLIWIHVCIVFCIGATKRIVWEIVGMNCSDISSHSVLVYANAINFRDLFIKNPTMANPYYSLCDLGFKLRLV